MKETKNTKNPTKTSNKKGNNVKTKTAESKNTKNPIKTSNKKETDTKVNKTEPVPPIQEEVKVETETDNLEKQGAETEPIQEEKEMVVETETDNLKEKEIETELSQEEKEVEVETDNLEKQEVKDNEDISKKVENIIKITRHYENLKDEESNQEELDSTSNEKIIHDIHLKKQERREYRKFMTKCGIILAICGAYFVWLGYYIITHYILK